MLLGGPTRDEDVVIPPSKAVEGDVSLFDSTALSDKDTPERLSCGGCSLWQGGFSGEPLISLDDTAKNENDRPPFDKGRLQGGTHWARADLPLTPSLCKERGFAEQSEDVDEAPSGHEFFAVELWGFCCLGSKIEPALTPERKPKTRQKNTSVASLRQRFPRKFKHLTSSDLTISSSTMPSIP